MPYTDTNITPVPNSVLALSEEFFEQFGISDLDTPTKLAMVQDVFPKWIAQKNAGTQKPLWTPINEMQALASASLADELYCGGKAGTGKTDLLIGEAITNQKKSIIFRSTYSEMEQLEERSRELLAGTGASYNASQTSKRWRDIPGGRTIKFGNLKRMSDIDKYRGRDHDFVGFDEIPTFQERVYLTVLAWARAEEGQRVRVICTGNPPTDSSQLWVKRRWAAWVDDRYPGKKAKPGELRWFVNKDGKDTEVESPDVEIYDSKGLKLEPLSRTFIPGEMLEHYKSTNYEARLQALPEPYRSQLLLGDFNLAEKDKERQVIPTHHVRLAMERWEDMDKPRVPLGGVGVDVARGGDDQTVISKRFDNWFAELIKYDGIQTPTGKEVAAVVQASLEDDRDARIEIDLGGVGSSPYDILSDNEFNVDGFNGATKSRLRDKSGKVGFRNRRAEAWWLFREALDPDSGEDIALPPDNELLADLTEPTFTLTANGYQIEEKEKIIERLGRSPDCGDAVVMNYNAVSRGGVFYF